MKLRLGQKWTELLAGLPESGMGYQNVRVTLTNGDYVEGVALMPRYCSSQMVSLRWNRGIKNIELATED